MTAITINDLNNAKIDVDHISDIATSAAPTATDRLGHTKSTVKGAIDSMKAYNIRGQWATATLYSAKDVAYAAGAWQLCVENHTSSDFTSDSANWRVFQGEIQSVSVASFGAVSDSSENGFGETAALSNLSAFNAAISAANGKNIDLNGLTYTLSGRPVNAYGSRLINGKVIAPSSIAGKNTQINSYSDDVNGVMIGRENLAAFMLACSAGTANNIFIYGDSTVAMGAAYIPKAEGLVKYALFEAGICWTNTANRGVSGTSWSDLSALGDLATTTKLIVIKYGINDAVKADALTTLAADARAKLSAIRAADNGNYSALSILLMGPNSTYAPTSSQDAKWYEDLRNIYLQLCKEFDCAYFDTYAYLQSTRSAPGFWLDNFTAIGRPGEGVHPTPDAAYWIWYEGFKKHVFGDGCWNRNKSNHLWNRGGSIPGFTALPTDEPQLYPMGVSIDYVTAANGWPANGLLTTIRAGASGTGGDVRQELTTLDAAPRRLMRTGALLVWTQWAGASALISAFSNGWSNKNSGYSAAGFSVDGDGYVTISGAVTGGTLGASAFTLPVGARPVNTHYYPVQGGLGRGEMGVVSIWSDGHVLVDAATNVVIFLDGCRFRNGGW